MRKITDHIINPTNDLLEINVLDAPGAGGANHVYEINGPDMNPCRVSFQNGPIAEHGVNGVTQEALLAVVADRLASFQSGPFACPENQAALDNVRAALGHLKARTMARMARGVEGRTIA